MKIEIQLFEGCPNSEEMKNRVLNAIKQSGFYADYFETYVETPEMADKIGFRGSPTVLVNGIDLENLPEPKEASLACRYYVNGLPSIEEIKEFIIQKAKT